jgi:hypothetical protein
MADDLPSAGSPGGRRVGMLVFLTAIILAAGVAIVGSWPGRSILPGPLLWPSEAPSSPSGSVREPIADYIGGAACRECHPGESALHERSGHAQTLRRAARSRILAWLDGRSAADPKFPDVQWTYRLRDDRILVERKDEGRTESLALDYALGSGKHGVTFVAIQGPEIKPAPSGIEHRLSYLADGPHLAVTPGQERSPRVRQTADAAESVPFGRPMGPDHLRQCLGCHATWVSPSAPNLLEATALIPNVSCERCHGPGRAHVEAARRGQDGLTMRMGYDRGEPWIEVDRCGECHRVPRLVSGSSISPENLGIVRFQGVGVSMSACYANGLGGLRCTTCHDPHDRASSDRGHYEAACLSCHRSAPAQKACPVSPAANCIDCHMPRREVPGNGVFTDHWIRKPAPTQPASTRSEAARTSSIRSSQDR